MSLNQLKLKIFHRAKRIKQGHLLWMCLDFVKKHPEHCINIGVQWIDNSNFIFNCKIFSNFVGRKTNTINNYFKHHGFKCRQLTDDIKKYYGNMFLFRNIPLSDGWNIRHLDGFTQSTTESESMKLKFIPSPKNKLQKSNIIENKQINNGENNLNQNNDHIETSTLSFEQKELENKNDLKEQNNTTNQQSQNFSNFKKNVKICSNSDISIHQININETNKNFSKTEKKKKFFDLLNFDDCNENVDDSGKNDDLCNYY